VFGDEVLERKHGTEGRRTPAYTPSEPALEVHRLKRRHRQTRRGAEVGGQ
jgi:hypothetical protein